MWASFLGMFGTGGASILAKVGLLAVVLLIGGFFGWRFASWEYKAAQAASEAKYAALVKADASRQASAENVAMEQLNDLNQRLVRANQQIKAHPAAGPCLDAGSVRIINGAITGATPAN